MCIYMNFECFIKVYYVKLRFSFIVFMVYIFFDVLILLDSMIKVDWRIKIVMIKINYNQK